MVNRALVTGGAIRLGRSMVEYLAGRGFHVAIHYATSEDPARDLAEQINASGGRAVTVKADLLDEGQTQGLVERAAELLGGPLTLLVNNASIFEYDNIGTATRESWDRHIESNLRAPYVLTQAFARQSLPPRTDDNGEHVAQSLVVNMVDQRVLKPTPEFSTYSIAKNALWTMTRLAAQGLAPTVRVNAIGPGTTVRGMRQTEQHFRDQRAASILKRGANPDEIVATLGYLIDAKSVTGQLICVDGGQHLAWQTPDIIG